MDFTTPTSTATTTSTAAGTSTSMATQQLKQLRDWRKRAPMRAETAVKRKLVFEEEEEEEEVNSVRQLTREALREKLLQSTREPLREKNERIWVKDLEKLRGPSTNPPPCEHMWTVPSTSWEPQSSAIPLEEEVAAMEAVAEEEVAAAAAVAEVEAEEEQEKENTSEEKGADFYLKKFNNALQYEKNYISLLNLDEDDFYPICFARIQETRYGRKVVLNILYRGREIDAYLPSKYLNIINHRNVDQFNLSARFFALTVRHISPKISDVKLVKILDLVV